MGKAGIPIADAFGGILVDSSRRILLREPANHYGGYVWTFPKGRADPGETPEQAALREVQEETGYAAEITGLVPGIFKGDTSTTAFYLMRPVGKQEPHGPETATTAWVSLAEAKKLVAMTKSKTGRDRDMAVLTAIEPLLGPSP